MTTSTKKPSFNLKKRNFVSLSVLCVLYCASCTAGFSYSPRSVEERPGWEPSNVSHESTDVVIHNRSNSNQFTSLYDREKHLSLFDPKFNAKCEEMVYGAPSAITGCAKRTAADALQVHPACWQLWTRTPNVLSRMSQVFGAGGNFGLVAQGTLMSEVDYAALNFVLAANPRIGGDIVEFGTAMGLTSLYLGLASKLRAGTFITYDYLDTDCRDKRVISAWLDNMSFKQADILSTREECAQRSTSQREGLCVPCNRGVANDVSRADFLLVDNGEKIHEASVYAKYMKVDSVLIVHDHCGPQWTEPYEYTLGKFGFEAKYGDYFASMGSCIRAWVRSGPGKFGVADLPSQHEGGCVAFGLQA